VRIPRVNLFRSYDLEIQDGDIVGVDNKGMQIAGDGRWIPGLAGEESGKSKSDTK
jgi:hypothetical protein